ncbi:MAG: hypothetical protein JJLCMIEE_01277 [Acidimicrobiales bacterium]|nr:MAG: M23 family metallopeptidase [Actinomycetota bacterium]MBV6508217.1 hypothetical protein [Acidimicrobiales bacterium]RIK07290.1 MAG: hypothetical protein DCC48_04210 [Acidobacteriota bacterium]
MTDMTNATGHTPGARSVRVSSPLRLAVALAVVAAVLTIIPAPSPSGATGSTGEAAGGGTARAQSSNSPDVVPFIGTFAVSCAYQTGSYCGGHHGYWAIDTGMPIGTPVYAAGPGTVTSILNHSAGGLSLYITHPDGRISGYLHLSQTLVSVGQSVDRYDQVARSGNTGNAGSYSHLHYEEQKPAWTKIDPGKMWACHGSTPVLYPDAAGYSTWQGLPYGVTIRNDGYGCLGGPGGQVWEYTTGYSNADANAVAAAAAHFGMSPSELQKQGVGLLGWMLLVAGASGTSPLVPPPPSTGPVQHETAYNSYEKQYLDLVRGYYVLTPEQAQAGGASLLVFFAAMAGA